MLARSFRDNPLNQAVIQKSARGRLRANYYGMRGLLDTAQGRATLCCLRDENRPVDSRKMGIRGVLVAAAPGYYPLPAAPSLVHQLRLVFGQGLGVIGRWGKVFRALEAVHPLDQQWYLALLGVEPEQQGRGLGTALLQRFVQQVDADGAPAYLETDRPENVAFYGQVGFDVVREVEVLGITVWCMQRPARAKTSKPDKPREARRD